VAEGLDKITARDEPAVGGQVVAGPDDAGPDDAGSAQDSQTGQKHKREPPKCSICGVIGHTARICKDR
jgi:hypothetical protein